MRGFTERRVRNSVLALIFVRATTDALPSEPHLGTGPAFAKASAWRPLLFNLDQWQDGLPSRSSRSERRMVGTTGIEPVTPTMSR